MMEHGHHKPKKKYEEPAPAPEPRSSKTSFPTGNPPARSKKPKRGGKKGR